MKNIINFTHVWILCLGISLGALMGVLSVKCPECLIADPVVCECVRDCECVEQEPYKCDEEGAFSAGVGIGRSSCPKCPECLDCSDVETALDECWDSVITYLPFLIVTEKVASQEYIKDEYTCKQFAEDYVTEMAKMGIRAYKINMTNGEPPTHARVCVEVEPQSGIFGKIDDGYWLRNIQIR